MDILTLLVLAVGVSMDAFAVSVCGSMSLRTEERVAGAVRFGLWFGGFQALMPVLGFFAAAQFRENISDYDHWIAFALLVYIGCKMIREAQESCALPKSSYSTKAMLTLAVATSIDALAVGVSFAFLAVNIWLAASMIGVVTFIFAFIGGLFGMRIGALGKSKAEIAGGLVLVFLGCKILYDHLWIV